MQAHIQRFYQNIQQELTCSITQLSFENPVVTSDGNTYERYAIQNWFFGGSIKSPNTNLNLSSTSLAPNIALRNVAINIERQIPSLLNEANKCQQTQSELISVLQLNKNKLIQQLQMASQIIKNKQSQLVVKIGQKDQKIVSLQNDLTILRLKSQNSQKDYLIKLQRQQNKSKLYLFYLRSKQLIISKLQEDLKNAEKKNSQLQKYYEKNLQEQRQLSSYINKDYQDLIKQIQQKQQQQQQYRETIKLKDQRIQVLQQQLALMQKSLFVDLKQALEFCEQWKQTHNYDNYYAKNIYKLKEVYKRPLFYTEQKQKKKKPTNQYSQQEHDTQQRANTGKKLLKKSQKITNPQGKLQNSNHKDKNNSTQSQDFSLNKYIFIFKDFYNIINGLTSYIKENLRSIFTNLNIRRVPQIAGDIEEIQRLIFTNLNYNLKQAENYAKKIQRLIFTDINLKIGHLSINCY